MYDNAAKVPSPSLLLPTEEQASQLATARDEVTKAEAVSRQHDRNRRQALRKWLAGPHTPVDADLTGYFTFDGDLAHLRNEAPGGKAEGNAVGLSGVDGYRGRAIHFDGDHGADFPGLFEVDRWTDFSLDFWMRDAAHKSKPIVVAQRHVRHRRWVQRF